MTCSHCSKSDVTLTNGRVVTHTRMANGAHDAVMVDGGDMSHAEWEDYCARVVGYTPKKQRFYKTARTTLACAAVAAGQFVRVRYSHTATNGVDWYDLGDLGVSYPAHHLTDFCL